MSGRNIELPNLSDEARLFNISGDIQEPSEGQVHTVVLKSDVEFDIISVHHSTVAGSCDVLIEIDGVAIDFDGANSDATLDADAGAADTFNVDIPSSGSEGKVGVGSKLTFTFSNVTSDIDGYSYTIKARRTATIT